jgi:hypothetical protein
MLGDSQPELTDKRAWSRPMRFLNEAELRSSLTKVFAMIAQSSSPPWLRVVLVDTDETASLIALPLNDF